LDEVGVDGDGSPMPSSAVALPRKRMEVLELDMGDGVILYDHSSSLVHHLNPSASLVWHLCDGGVGEADLAAEISEELGLDRIEVTEHVRALIRELFMLGLVEDANDRGGPESHGEPTAGAGGGR